MVYTPAEDSYLLKREVKKYLTNINKKHENGKSKIKVLDMGSGSGIQALTCLEQGINKQSILCADIDKGTVGYLKKQKLKTVHTDLFSRINKDEKFDLIIFNAPYLPEDEYDKEKDTTAGKEGYETIIRFIRQAKTHLDGKGVILLLFSSLSKPQIILNYAKREGYKTEKLAEEKLFFEKLYVYLLRINRNL